MSIDIIIVGIFLTVNLVTGLYYGRGIRTIKEYAIGDRNFNTATIAATIIATWISGSFFTVSVSQTYKEGVWFIPAAMGDVISLLIIGHIFAPRMREFLGSLSVAESMGNLYGKQVRLITAICSIAQAVAMTALQIKVFSSIFSHFFDFPSHYATCLSSFVVIFYSTFGGIKAVTFTDVIQFFTFGVFIPLFALFIWQAFGNSEAIVQTFQTDPLFDFKQLLNHNDPKFWPSLVMMLWFLIPSMSSPTFQRTLMARNINQISQSFNVAALGYFFIIMFICMIGLLVLAHDATLDPNNIVVYIVDNYSFPGLKGFALIGIMAMVMSTADSWINTGAVIFAHDLCSPLGIKFKNELFLSRIFSIFVGLVSTILVLSSSSLFKLFSLQANFYMPIVTIPLMLAILGFRSSAKAVKIGMFTGALWTIIWKINITPTTGIDSVIPAMAMNLVAYLGAHYLLRQPGGWIDRKEDLELKEKKRQKKKRNEAISNYFKAIPKFSILEYCSARTPKNQIVYSYFAFSGLLSIMVAFSIDKSIYRENVNIINCLQIVSLFISTIFICRNLMFSSKFQEKYWGIIWYGAIFIGLALISSLLVLISKFSQIAVVVFILNLTMIGMLLNWQTTLVMIGAGVSLAIFLYKIYIGDSLSSELQALELKILYVIFMIIGFLLAFIKPKQEMEARAHEKISHLGNYIQYAEAELEKSLNLRSEFLRNIEHEARTPITGITSLGEILYDNYYKLTEEQRYQAVKDIAKSSVRLNSLVDSILKLSEVSSLEYKLKISSVNLSDLLDKCIKLCKKLYLNDKDIEFIFDIDEDVVADCDEACIKATFENLIINAIQYSKEGTIKISLKAEDEEVAFVIKDDGIGIPPSELFDIFGAFVVSSKTRTPAGGRGVGLALCKKVIQLHKGYIGADSNGKKGATFTFTFPLGLTA